MTYYISTGILHTSFRKAIDGPLSSALWEIMNNFTDDEFNTMNELMNSYLHHRKDCDKKGYNKLLKGMFNHIRSEHPLSYDFPKAIKMLCNVIDGLDEQDWKSVADFCWSEYKNPETVTKSDDQYNHRYIVCNALTGSSLTHYLSQLRDTHYLGRINTNGQISYDKAELKYDAVFYRRNMVSMVNYDGLKVTFGNHFDSEVAERLYNTFNESMRSMIGLQKGQSVGNNYTKLRDFVSFYVVCVLAVMYSAEQVFFNKRNYGQKEEKELLIDTAYNTLFDAFKTMKLEDKDVYYSIKISSLPLNIISNEQVSQEFPVVSATQNRFKA